MNDLLVGAAPKVLQNALSWDYSPGSNLPGDLHEGDWRFLLPHLCFENTVCVGAVSTNRLRVLSEISTRVVTIPGVLRASDRGQASSLPSNVVAAEAAELAQSGGQPAYGLLYFAHSADLHRIAGQPGVFQDLLGLLKPSGLFFSQSAGPSPRASRIVERELAQAGFDSRDYFLLIDWSARCRSAVPIADRVVIDYCRSLTAPRQLVKRLVLGVRKFAPREKCALRASRGRTRSGRIPDYLEAAAARSGISLAGYRWGLQAGGRHPSKKVVILLFPPDGEKPEAIAKIARHPSFNRRLENEFLSLRALQATESREAKAAPKPLFLGSEAGLMMSAQTAVEGRPLRELARPRPDSAEIRKAVNWFVSLAWKTAWYVEGGGVAALLSGLADRFYESYASPAEEREFLQSQLSLISECRRFPVVFQHGDPHTGNVWVTKGGGLAILDWESAEPAGMPLWDLFYFLQTTASLSAGGRLSESAVLLDVLLSPTGWKALTQAAIGAYCDVLHLNQRLVDPLFYTCWMHRALKEATRLPLEHAGKGKAIELLRSAMARSRGPAVKLFFG